MSTPIHHLTAIRYHDDGRPWDAEVTLSPRWDAVVAAIRRMDDDRYPIVQLNCSEHDDDDEIFNIIGGDGRFALFEQVGGWQYTDPAGSDEPVRLWQSDQGYVCAARHVLTDVDRVLRIAKRYYDTGSYDDLDTIA